MTYGEFLWQHIERLRTENERLREALEMMVEMVEMNGFGRDYAMDVARAALKQEACVDELIERSRYEADIVRAAVHWWESHRPLSFTVHEHVEHCTVNTRDDSEKKLARAVANAVRISEGQSND